MACLQLDYGGRFHPLHYNQVSVFSNFGQRDACKIKKKEKLAVGSVNMPDHCENVFIYITFIIQDICMGKRLLQF